MDETRIEEIIARAVAAAVHEMDERDAYLRALVQKHETAIYGNGKEGLITVVDRLKHAIEPAQQMGQKVVEGILLITAIGIMVLLASHGLIGK